MMQIKFNFNIFARVCHSLAACQRHTLTYVHTLAAVIDLSNYDVYSLRYVPYVARCVGWKPRFM